MRAKNWREKIAFRTARLMCDASSLSYDAARQEAVRILGCGKLFPRQLPTRKEIREKLVLLSKDQQTVMRRHLFEELLVAMRMLQAFRPQVDAEILTAEITPDTHYIIELIDAPVEMIRAALPDTVEKMIKNLPQRDAQASLQSDVLPINFEGMFFLTLRMVEADESISPKPCVGIVELESEIERLAIQAENNVVQIDNTPKDRFVQFATLLWPLEEVILSPTRHPEGDALYHSLQVFQLALDVRCYDEEFLLAALLHDVGKAIDPEDHVTAGLAALDQYISKRTAMLIDLHHQAQFYREGTLGMRARRRLEANPDFEELLLLAECDKKGRQCGVAVPDVEQALEQIRGVSDAFPA